MNSVIIMKYQMLHHKIAKKKELENFSLWKKLHFFSNLELSPLNTILHIIYDLETKLKKEIKKFKILQFLSENLKKCFASPTCVLSHTMQLIPSVHLNILIPGPSSTQLQKSWNIFNPRLKLLCSGSGD